MISSTKNGVVLVVTTVPETIYRLLSNSIVEMKNEGFIVKAASSHESWVDVAELASNLEIEIFPIPFSRRINLLEDLRALLSMVMVLRGVIPDIVHAHTPKAGFVVAIASLFVKRFEFYYTVRGLPFETQFGFIRILLIALEKFACNRASKVYSVSKSVADVLVDESICQRSKLSICGGYGSAQGVDSSEKFNPRLTLSESDLNALRSKHFIETDDFVLGYIGRVTEDKGIEYLASLWERLVGKGFSLVIVGAVDQVRNGVANPVISNFLKNESIQFVGRTEDVRKYIMLFDLLVFPTRREGFPNVVLECASMGVPSVAWDVTGCKDAIISGETGWLEKPFSVDDMTNRIITLSKNPIERSRVGQNARKRVEQYFQPKNRIDELISSYKNSIF